MVLPAGRVARRRFVRRAKSSHKRDYRTYFCRAEILAIGRHVAATLDHLTDELVGGEAYSHTVQRRPSLPAQAPKRMAVAALLVLENQRPLEFERWIPGASSC